MCGEADFMLNRLPYVSIRMLLKIIFYTLREQNPTVQLVKWTRDQEKIHIFFSSSWLTSNEKICKIKWEKRTNYEDLCPATQYFRYNLCKKILNCCCLNPELYAQWIVQWEGKIKMIYPIFKF